MLYGLNPNGNYNILHASIMADGGMTMIHIRIRKVFSFLMIMSIMGFSVCCAESGAQTTDRDTEERGHVPISVSYNLNMWDQYWKPGEHFMKSNDEAERRVDDILQQVDMISAGSVIRTNADSFTLEQQYQSYQDMLQNGMVVNEQLFDDMGTYIWLVGFPDEESITADQAWRLAYQVLLEDAGVSETELIHYYPQISYEVGNPENPFWRFHFMPYDLDVSIVYDVAVYAHDGSICGYKIAVSVG